MGASLAIPIVGSCIGCDGGSSSSESPYRTRLVILGSSGGVSWWQSSGNLQLLANGADFLVHEVIDREWMDIRFGFSVPEKDRRIYVLKEHMLQSHTSIEDVGIVAEECRAKNLVLNHIVPGDAPLVHLQKAGDNFSGRLIIGEDLMEE